MGRLREEEEVLSFIVWTLLIGVQLFITILASAIIVIMLTHNYSILVLSFHKYLKECTRSH